MIHRDPSGSTDDYGNEIPAETSEETVCELQQRSREEQPDQGELGDSLWLLVLPAATEIDTGDAVVVDGYRFELVGPPWTVRNPRTRTVSHVEATVRRAAGEEDVS